jgi:hypothetical protein
MYLCRRYLLEKYYDVRVKSMYVVGLHPDVGENAFVDAVPHMAAETEALMAMQRLKHANAKRLASQTTVSEWWTRVRTDLLRSSNITCLLVQHRSCASLPLNGPVDFVGQRTC